MEWLTALTGVASGGLFGLVGTGFKLWMGNKKEEAKLAHQLALAKETRENMKLEMELVQTKQAHDLELQENDNDAKGLHAAIAAEANIAKVHLWVNDVRGCTRPFLTVLLIAVTWYYPDNPEFSFMAATAVTFWFGDRPLKK